MSGKEWYGAKTLYRVTTHTPAGLEKLYEERVVVIRATSFDDALAEAEKEALNYADEDQGTKYLGYVNVYKIFDKKLNDKTEVFSLMRENKLTPKKYIDKYFDTGKERTQKQ